MSTSNDKGQYLYYGKAGGWVVTGNEDGVKACAMETLYALSHIGFTIPPQADVDGSVRSAPVRATATSLKEVMSRWATTVSSRTRTRPS